MSENFLIAAAIAMILLGLVHSILGEKLIFRHLRKDGQWIDTQFKGLRSQQIRVLWATWHLLSLFGCAIAGILLIHALHSDAAQASSLIAQGVALAFAVAAPFWFFGTKGRHPAWIVFILIAMLSWLGQ